MHMLGFPVIPNMSDMHQGNPEECDSNKCDLTVLFYEIHIAFLHTDADDGNAVVVGVVDGGL